MGGARPLARRERASRSALGARRLRKSERATLRRSAVLAAVVGAIAFDRVGAARPLRVARQNPPRSAVPVRAQFRRKGTSSTCRVGRLHSQPGYDFLSPDGLLLSSRDGRWGTIEYSYDPADRVLSALSDCGTNEIFNTAWPIIARIIRQRSLENSIDHLSRGTAHGDARALGEAVHEAHHRHSRGHGDAPRAAHVADPSEQFGRFLGPRARRPRLLIEEPAVARVLARVSKRRIAYLEECYRGLGSRKPRARQQALLAYAAYLGVLRLRVEGPGELPDARGRTWTRGVSRGDGGDAGSRVVKRGQRHEQRGSPCWHRQGRSAPSGGSGRAARAFA